MLNNFLNTLPNNNIVTNFIVTTPPITRILLSFTVLTSLIVYFDFLKPQSISYSRFYLEDLQFYRMFTTFFYYGKVNFELIMNFIFLYRYSSMLEENYTKRSDYFYTLFLIFNLLIAIGTIFYIPFLATSLANTLTYIWSRKNPQGLVQIFGFVSFSAFFLPFVFPLVSLVFEGKVPNEELIGIIVGQIVFYFRDIYPKIGHDYFGTPCIIHRIFKEECEKCKKKPSNMASRMDKVGNESRMFKVGESKNIGMDIKHDQPSNDVKNNESYILKRVDKSIGEASGHARNDAMETSGDYAFDHDVKPVVERAFDHDVKPGADFIVEDHSGESIVGDHIGESVFESSSESIVQCQSHLNISGETDLEDEIDYDLQLEDSDLSKEFECIEIENSEVSELNEINNEIIDELDRMDEVIEVNAEDLLMPSPAVEIVNEDEFNLEDLQSDDEFHSDDFESIEIESSSHSIGNDVVLAENVSYNEFKSDDENESIAEKDIVLDKNPFISDNDLMWDEENLFISDVSIEEMPANENNFIPKSIFTKEKSQAQEKTATLEKEENDSRDEKDSKEKNDSHDKSPSNDESWDSV
jgi:hypothetical protein